LSRNKISSDDKLAALMFYCTESFRLLVISFTYNGINNDWNTHERIHLKTFCEGANLDSGQTRRFKSSDIDD